MWAGVGKPLATSVLRQLNRLSSAAMIDDDSGSNQTFVGPASSPRGSSPEVLRLEGAERYRDVCELGAGGMGEVRLTRDFRLDREVALKRLRSTLTHPEYIERFLREVRVQGQLEHPAVVPVYDLGLTPEGAPYFTMKRVRGQTLFQVITLLKAGDPAATARFTRWRLLAAFNTVCLAIDSAHSRGVLHRDLKPGNIMLGEFGEVHVLDWGLAKIRGSAEPEASDSAPVIREGETDAGHQTAAGSAMGTPGYMSPEQADGLLDTLDERTDVYALGVILHELLFLEPVHGANTPVERLLSTRRRHLPDSRRDDVPPELDAIWRTACAASPDDRYPSARAMADAVERFLDGERDEVRRRELADAQLTIAANAMSESEAGRRQALQALGRALALDPTNAKALTRLSTLLATPPLETPVEAQRQLDALDAARTKSLLLASAFRLLIWTFGMGATMVLLGVKSNALAALTLALMSSATVATWAAARSRRVSDWQFPAGVFGLVAVGTLAVVINPLLVVPTLAATHAMLFASNAPGGARRAMMFAAVAMVVVPALWAPLGGYVTLSDETLGMTSPLIKFDSPSVPFVLLFLSLVPVVTPTALVGRLRDDFVAAERNVVVQSAAVMALIPTDGRKDVS